MIKRVVRSITDFGDDSLAATVNDCPIETLHRTGDDWTGAGSSSDRAPTRCTTWAASATRRVVFSASTAPLAPWRILVGAAGGADLMCVTLIIAAGVAIAAAGAGAYSKIQSANANKRSAKYQAMMEQRQLYREREQQRIAALQTENGRQDQFDQARSSALAAIGASNLGEHISFFQSIDPNSRRAFLQDVRSIRLGLTASEAGINDQVGVSEMRKEVGVYNANLSKVGAISDFVQTAMSVGSFYNNYATPKPAAPHG
jgi:hypothetical protein